MNHKPRTRLAAMLLACLLLCPSPGRSEAAVRTDVPVPQEAAIPAEETLESQETMQEPSALAPLVTRILVQAIPAISEAAMPVSRQTVMYKIFFMFIMFLQTGQTVQCLRI